MIFLVKSQVVIQSFNTFSLCPIRYGHHGIAADIFQRLTYSVSSEHFYFWLMGLGKICNGEHGLNDVSNKDLVERLSMASSHILEGLIIFFVKSQCPSLEFSHLTFFSSLKQVSVQFAQPLRQIGVKNFKWVIWSAVQIFCKPYLSWFTPVTAFEPHPHPP